MTPRSASKKHRSARYQPPPRPPSGLLRTTGCPLGMRRTCHSPGRYRAGWRGWPGRPPRSPCPPSNQLSGTWRVRKPTWHGASEQQMSVLFLVFVSLSGLQSLKNCSEHFFPRNLNENHYTEWIQRIAADFAHLITISVRNSNFIIWPEQFTSECYTHPNSNLKFPELFLNKLQ